LYANRFERCGHVWAHVRDGGQLREFL
jgi:hypothetical protein